MASYTGAPSTHHLAKELWLLHAGMTTDGSGVVLNTQGATLGGSVDQDGDPLLTGPGILSIAKTGTGLYTITLEQPWWKLLYFGATVVSSGGATAGGFKIVTRNPRGSVVNSIASKTINIVYEAAGAATAFNSLEALFVFHLKNTNV